MVETLKKVFWVFLILEILCFVVMGNWLGYGVTLLLLLASSFFGWVLLRKTAQYTLLQASGQLKMGAWQDLVNARFFVAGMLFFIPGLVTDFLGLLCLLPIVHKQFSAWLNKKTHHSANDHDYYETDNETPKPKRTLEGEFWRDKDK